MTVLDVGLGTARSFELVQHQVGVMGGGDEVVIKRLPHVLIHTNVGGVKDQTFQMGQVLQEAIFGHVLILLCWISAKIGTQKSRDVKAAKKEHRANGSLHVRAVTCRIRLVFVYKLDGVIQSHSFPLLQLQEI